MPGWNYRENLLPDYLSDYFDSVIILTNNMVLNNETGKINYRKEILPKGEKITVRELSYRLRVLPFSLYSRIRLYKNFKSVLEYEKPTHIYINGLQFLSLIDINYIKKKFPQIKILAEQNAYFGKSGNSWISRNILHKVFYRLIIRKALPSIDKIYMGSNAALKFAVDLYGFGSNSEILPLGYDSKLSNSMDIFTKKELRLKYNISQVEIVFTTGGKIDSEKKLIELIDSFNILNSANTRLIIFGSLLDDIKHSVIQKINENDKITFIGWLDQMSMLEIFRLSDVAVFPGTKSSIWESALSMNLPIIAQFWDGMDYMNLGGNIFYLLNNGDLMEIQSKLAFFVDNPNYLSLVSKEIQITNKQSLSYSNIANRIYCDFQNVGLC